MPFAPLPPFPADADELAAACGMFVSPAKAANAHAAANKPRKLFLDEEAGKGAEGGRPSLCDPQLALLPAELQSPALWVQAAT